MYITTGSLKGQLINFPKNIRPVSGKHKKMIFDVLRQDISGSSWLDLFAGSGQIGIEALSNGVGRVTFVEKDRANTRLVANNLQKLKIPTNQFEIINDEVNEFLLGSVDKYDFVFADPPYLKTDWKFLTELKQVCYPNTIIILKFSPHNPPPDDSFNLLKSKNLRDTVINFYHP